jgi:hypothetical protein
MLFQDHFVANPVRPVPMIFVADHWGLAYFGRENVVVFREGMPERFEIAKERDEEFRPRGAE